jgi:hypothetical protein
MVRLVHRAYALEHAVPPRLPPRRRAALSGFQKNPWQLRDVDMAVVASKRVVAGLATSSAGKVTKWLTSNVGRFFL